jgi:transposase
MAKGKKSAFERLSSSQMNRKDRRNLGRRLAGIDPGLTIVHSNAGGIDVGNESHFVAVPPDRDTNPVQGFGCWTADLKRMAEWLKTCRIDTEPMQATGVYSIPLYDFVTGYGIRVVLANAQHTKNVPGRKSDVQECQWLMKLHTYGLLRDSFQLEEKMDDISGMSGQAIIAAILKGERNPWVLAELKHETVKASREEVARSLEGTGASTCCLNCGSRWKVTILRTSRCGNATGNWRVFCPACPARIRDIPSQPGGASAAATEQKAQRARKTRKAKRNEPTVDLKAELKRICGVDLTSIDGIEVITAQTIISEVGTDMTRFRTENHFASWLGLTPSKDISGGKVVGPGRRRVQNRVAMALRMAATMLLNSKSYLGGRYRHLRKKLPSHASAIKAMARYLAVLVYRMLTHGEAWVDRVPRNSSKGAPNWKWRV